VGLKAMKAFWRCTLNGQETESAVSALLERLILSVNASDPDSIGALSVDASEVLATAWYLPGSYTSVALSVSFLDLLGGGRFFANLMNGIGPQADAGVNEIDRTTFAVSTEGSPLPNALSTRQLLPYGRRKCTYVRAPRASSWCLHAFPCGLQSAHRRLDEETDLHTDLQQGLVKTGGRLVRQVQYCWLLMERTGNAGFAGLGCLRQSDNCVLLSQRGLPKKPTAARMILRMMLDG
jgi:hypothetical protein